MTVITAIKRIALFIIAAVLLALNHGCGSMGLAKPETAAQAVAQADAAFSGVVFELTELNNRGRLSESRAERVDEVIERANDALDLAWAAVAARDETGAQRYLGTVLSLTNELIRIAEEDRQ